jgi:hypothetical protein
VNFVYSLQFETRAIIVKVDCEVRYVLSLTRSLKQFDLWLNSTTTATLWAFKSCPVVYTYLMSMNIFFIFLLYRCGS